MNQRRGKPRFAICVDNAEYPASLEFHKLYRVIPDMEAKRHGDLRVVDESGEDYLYPADYFVPVDLPRNTVRALNRSYTRRLQSADYFISLFLKRLQLALFRD